MSDNIKVATVYHSGFGHTKVQAEAINRGAAAVAGEKAVIYAVEDLSDTLSELADADAIIFGSPTYMGSVSAPFKAFMDKSSTIWMERGWSNKFAGGFTNSSSQSGDKAITLQALSTFAAQHGMLWVSLDIPPGFGMSDGSNENLNRMGASHGAMAQSFGDLGPDVAPPDADQRTAEAYGKRIAEVTAQFKRGA